MYLDDWWGVWIWVPNTVLDPWYGLQTQSIRVTHYVSWACSVWYIRSNSSVDDNISSNDNNISNNNNHNEEVTTTTRLLLLLLLMMIIIISIIIMIITTTYSVDDGEGIRATYLCIATCDSSCYELRVRFTWFVQTLCDIAEYIIYQVPDGMTKIWGIIYMYIYIYLFIYLCIHIYYDHTCYY